MPSHLLSNHNPGKFCHQIHFWKFVCPAGYHRKHNYCRLHFSGSMSAVFLLDLVSSRPWQGSRQWEKGRIQSPSLSEVESLTIAVLPNLQGWRSLVLPSPRIHNCTSHHLLCYQCLAPLTFPGVPAIASYLISLLLSHPFPTSLLYGSQSDALKIEVNSCHLLFSLEISSDSL